MSTIPININYANGAKMYYYYGVIINDFNYPRTRCTPIIPMEKKKRRRIL